MNYYMPYFNMYPNMIPNVAPVAGASKGIFSKLLGKGLNWSNILNTTQKTLGLVNQAIPVIKQVAPVMQNAKTIFKVMNEFKRFDTPSENQTYKETLKARDIEVASSIVPDNITFDGAPTFFMN
ncbi:MAG: hypothetical protein E7173_01885 [Firmicutes bacterium]|nr:hypothetical protein [Bacillota bacterium]